MALFIGNKCVTPAIITGTESGDIIIATNNSSKAVASDSKVWLNKSGNGYSIIDFSTKQFNGTIQGNVSVNMNTNLASNFSDGYIHVDGAGTIYSSATLIMKITTGSNVSSMQELVRFYPLTEFYIKQGDLRMWTETANSEITCTSVSPNTTYWIKVVLGNSLSKISYSLDGITYTGEVSLSNTNYNNQETYIGNFINAYESRPFLGTIDLANSYFTINGAEYWRGISETFNPSLSEENTIMGYAKDSAAIGSTCRVETLKPKKVLVDVTVTQSGDTNIIYIDNDKLSGDTTYVSVGNHTYSVATPEEGINSGSFVTTNAELWSGHSLSVTMSAGSNPTLTVVPKYNESTISADVTLTYTVGGKEYSFDTNSVVVPSGTTVHCYASTIISGDTYEAEADVVVTSSITENLVLDVAKIDTTIIVDENATVTIEEAE